MPEMREQLEKIWCLAQRLPAVLRTPKRKIVVAAAAVAAVTTVGAVVVALPAGTGTTKQIVSFREGSSLRRISRELRDRHLVRSELLFALYARLSGKGGRLQAGTYLFDDGMSPAEILRKLADGDVYIKRFSLPEGYSIYQVAELLEKQGFFSRDKFLAKCFDRPFLRSVGIEAGSAEGYLCPCTYNIVPGTDEAEVIRMMVTQFERTCRSRFDARVRGSRMSWQQVLTLASMIEKEAVVPEEMPTISSVFRNRLRRKMRLQSDPTALYGVRAFGGKVTHDDILRPSPYNTYTVDGLPAGPIGNPGSRSIEAVLAPEPTPYLYFVARKDGTHYFSKTLDEHNRAVTAFLRSGGMERK